MRLWAVLRIVAVGIAVAFAGAFAAAEEMPKAEIVPQLGHSGQVASVAFSPDGKAALSGSYDKTLRLWDLATGREIRKFEGHSGGVTSVAFSPDGKAALSGSYDQTLRLWDLVTGREIRKLEGHSGPVFSVAFSPDGKAALSGSDDKTLRLWDLATGREIRKFEGHSDRVTSVAFSPDGKAALSGSYDKTLKLWDVASGQILHDLQAQADVDSLAFSPDGKHFVSGGWGEWVDGSMKGVLKLWDAETGELLRAFAGHSGQVFSVAFSPDGKAALSGGWDKTVRLWDLAAGREVQAFEGHSDGVRSVALSPDGKAALSGSDDKTLRLWDLARGRQVQAFGGHLDGVSSVAFSPDAKAALSGGYDKTLRLWDLATGREIRIFEGHSERVLSVAFSPDGQAALSGSYDNTVRLWDLATAREIRMLEGHSRFVTSVVVSPNGKAALSGSADKTIRLWDLAAGREVQTLKGHSRVVYSVVFSPDGKAALSGSLDKTLRLWDLATGREMRKFEGHPGQVFSVAFSPDGKAALSGSDDKTLRLWDLVTGREIRKLEGHSGVVFSVAFSPDGKAALSGSDDKTLRLWDLATGREIRMLEGHSGEVTSVAFSPDGKAALSGGWDGTVRLWNAQRGEPLVSMLASRDGHQLAITPNGFFSASRRDTDMLAIVRGMDVTTIGQVHQSLYNPDLVREAMAGDPNGEVRRAAEVVNLEKVLDSGPAPEVQITSPEQGSKSGSDLVTVAVRIKDRGKGIGRIEWRINGVTVGVLNAPANAGKLYEVKRELALDRGANAIEVVAYNASNLLASLPAQTSIAYTGPAGAAKPKLHILAIGINAYEDNGWVPPGSDRREYFPALEQSVGDAKALAAEMRKAAAPLYGDRVQVTMALDADATAKRLDKIVSWIASDISPRDTFVFYAAGHGYSLDGRYYLIPQDYQGGGDPKALASRAIGQEKLQDWIANRIKAKKAIILLDTCRSGALTQGYSRARVGDNASEAAIGRLHEATGRPVLTAAAALQDAQEVTFATGQGYGLFTAALIDALHHARADEHGQIWVSDLAAHVQDLVPKIASGAEVRLAIPRGRRGSEGESAQFSAQSAHFGTTGSDFALVAKLP